MNNFPSTSPGSSAEGAFQKTIKPILYCDVDGVINIASRRAKGVMVNTIRRSIPTVEKVFPQVPIRFRWNEAITTGLAELPVRFIWLTTWNYQAVHLLEPLLGIKSESVLYYKMQLNEFRNQKRKYDLLKEHQASNPTPFIWVDDVATKRYDPSHWLTHSNRLIIQPNPKLGVTDNHLQEIKSFLAAV